eukprot:1500097-Prymnesium_polylepis.2
MRRESRCSRAGSICSCPGVERANRDDTAEYSIRARRRGAVGRRLRQVVDCHRVGTAEDVVRTVGGVVDCGYIGTVRRRPRVLATGRQLPARMRPAAVRARRALGCFVGWCGGA